jgi:hypothetical protein
VFKVGVIVTDKPVTSVKLVLEDEKESDLKTLTTCKTFPPPAGAAHLRPVAVALSATILQEQSQRIVLRGLKPLSPRWLNQEQQV